MKYQNQDVTSVFTPYTFDFQGSDVITAARVDSNFVGSWIRSNASQDNPKILLNFGTHYQLGMLNQDWQQVQRTDNTILFSVQSHAVTFERVP
jgi:hypothetical protein